MTRGINMKAYDHDYKNATPKPPIANWQAALMFIVFMGLVSTPIFYLG